MAKKKQAGAARPKKPFYKRVWFWILIVIILAAVGGALGGGGDDDDKDTTSSDKSASSSSAVTKKSSSKSAESSSKADSGKISRSQFDAIKLGDLMNKGQGGSTLEDLKKQFGEPDSTTSSETNGVKTDILTWTNVEGGFGANIIVSFTDGNAYDKNLTGFELSRKQKIALKDFTAFANGTKYAAFEQKWGKPDYYNETLIGGSTTIIAGYTSGVQGDFGANFNVTFTNGALTGKSQYSMK